MAARLRGGMILRNATILAGLVALSISVSAQAAPDPAKRGASVVTNHEAWNLYEKYLNAWNTTSIEQRFKIAEKVLSDNIEYLTVRHDLSTGRSLVIEDMATFHEKFPGGHFEIGDVSSHHNVALLTWVIIQADGTEFARGHDQLTVDRDGKISKIITFGPSAKDPN
ncbi:nuclear transport factor 2 family protein [Bradyrhizobium sp. WSM3983]|uniref:nuclear transport factor 2 family protein n=1 Tax=Bradyrhizobium sp. WSM3983 TaxID=1038867 RepID=UPI000A0443AE|nr:nuclear transport factor 2 family protein [Bradyrhizobium sp. WSM3983]